MSQSSNDFSVKQIQVEEIFQRKEEDALKTQSQSVKNSQQNTNVNQNLKENQRKQQETLSTFSDKINQKQQQKNVPLKEALPSLFKKIKVFCPYKNEAIFVCTQKCEIQALICNQNECLCQKAHYYCQTYKISKLQQKINESYRKYDDKEKKNIINEIKYKIQQLLTQTKKIQQDLISKVQYMGLSDQQIQFVNLWNNGSLTMKSNSNNIFAPLITYKLQSVKGQLFNSFNLSKLANRKNLVQLTEIHLVKSIKEYQQKYKQNLENLKKSIESIKKNFTGSIFQNSSIIESKSEEQRLISLLPQFKAVQRLSKLNFRNPSQNLWNKFIKKNVIYRNILILVRNSYQKTFGAFLNCNLHKYSSIFGSEQDNKIKDLKYQSQKQEQFLFSLTYNKKIKSLKKIDEDQWAIQPYFSNGQNILKGIQLQSKQRNTSLFRNKNERINFQINDTAISFLGGILFQKFENLQEIDITGVDSNHYSNSTAQVIEIYHIVMDSKQSFNKLHQKQTSNSINTFGSNNNNKPNLSFNQKPSVFMNPPSISTNIFGKKIDQAQIY